MFGFSVSCFLGHLLYGSQMFMILLLIWAFSLEIQYGKHLLQNKRPPTKTLNTQAGIPLRDSLKTGHSKKWMMWMLVAASWRPAFAQRQAHSHFLVQSQQQASPDTCEQLVLIQSRLHLNYRLYTETIQFCGEIYLIRFTLLCHTFYKHLLTWISALICQADPKTGVVF